MEILQSLIQSPIFIILACVASFIIARLYFTYKQEGNTEKFRLIIINAISDFIELVDASKMSKEQFTQELTEYVKKAVKESNLTIEEIDLLINSGLINRLVKVFVDTLYEATAKAEMTALKIQGIK